MEKFYQWLKKKGFLTIIVSVLVIGILIHGSRIFSSYYFHDDLTLTRPGATFTSGRWFLQILYDIEMKLMGFHINAKGFMGVLTLVLLAVICCIIADGLKLKKQSSRILLSAIVVTFPFTTTLFSFTFTSVYYCISLIMALVAAKMVDQNPFKKFKIGGVLIAILLLGLSMGVYQTSLCTYIAFSVLLKLKETINSKDENWKTFAIQSLKYLAVCIGGILFYFIVNKIMLQMLHLTLTDYQGLNNMGSFSIGDMINRILFSYKEFFFPSTIRTHSMYYIKPIRLCYRLVLLFLLMFAISFFVKNLKKKNYQKALILGLLYIIAPLAINSVFLVGNDHSSTVIYSLMMFSSVFIFIYLITCIDQVDLENSECKGIRLVPIIISILLIFGSAHYGYVANICYRRAAHQQEQTIGYFNRMITRIQSVKGYKTDYPVVYINELQKNEEELNVFSGDLDRIYVMGANNFSSLINIYNWKDFMKMWCGYAPKIVTNERQEYFQNLKEIKEMPSYPNDGSIQIIEDTIVIKFA